MIVCCDGKTETIYFNDRYIGWKKYEGIYVSDNYDGLIEFVVTPRQDRCYTFKMTYNGDMALTFHIIGKQADTTIIVHRDFSLEIDCPIL